MRRLRAVLAAALAGGALLAARPARAQVPVITGSDDSPAVRVARRIVERGRYVYIDRDTVLGPDFRIDGDLVIYDAEVRLEGSVEGSVAVLGGDFWIRPGGRVGGAIAVLDGGVYPSALAILRRDSIFQQDPRTTVATQTVPTADGGYTAAIGVTPPPGAPFFAPGYGPLPSYDRVNGLTVYASGTIRPTRDFEGPSIRVFGAYRFRNDDHLGGGARFNVPLGRQNLHLTGEVSRLHRTNDTWIRPEFSNTARAVVFGDDERDYWDSDLIRVQVERPVGIPLISGESWLGPRVGVQLSRDRSLPTRDPWSLWGDALNRENPEVLEGTIVSGLIGTEYHWRGLTSRFDGSADLEVAPGGVSDAEFSQGLVQGSYEATAMRTHTLRVYFRGMAPLSGNAPPQREGIMGGAATLATERTASFRGDHLVFIESSYAVPLNSIVLPYVGSPSVEAVHMVGAAWTGDNDRPWVQNAGVGIVFTLVRARVLIDPATGGTAFAFGLSLPSSR
jgi:hypothetical protein